MMMRLLALSPLLLVACGGSAATTSSASAVASAKTSAAPVASAAPSTTGPTKKGKVTIDKVAVREGNEADIKKLVEAVQPKIEACYEKALATDPALAGTVKPRIACGDEGGECLIADSKAGSIDDRAPVSECIMEVVRTAGYPKAPAKSVLAVEVDITLAPGGG